MSHIPAKDSLDAQAKVIFFTEDDAHGPTNETELTYDYTYYQLAPIDYWT